MKALKKTMIGLAVFLLLFVLAGFFIVPPIVKEMAVKKISQTLQREVAIEKIQVNPLRLSLTVKGFTVWEQDTEEVFFSFHELFLNLEIMSIFRGALVVKEATLTTPFLQLIRNKDESYNIADFFSGGDENSKDGNKKPFQFSLNNIRVIDGKVVFQDAPKGVSHLVEDMQVELPFISNINYYADTFVTPSFGAVINGTRYLLKGRTKPFGTSLLTEFDVVFNDLNIPAYLPYFPLKINGRIPSAFLDADAKLIFQQDKKEGQQLLLSGQFLLKNAAMDDQRGQPVLRFPYVAVDLAPSSILKNDIRLNHLIVRDPEINLQHSRQGELNILSLWESSRDDDGAEKTVVVIETFAVDNGSLSYQDNGLEKPFRFSSQNVQVRGSNFSTIPNEEGHVTLNFSLPARGAAEFRGSFRIAPSFTALWDMDVNRLILPPFQAYIERVFRVKIARGNLSAQGQLQLRKIPEQDVAFRFSGNAALNSFGFLDTSRYNELLSGDSLNIRGVEMSYPSLVLRVKELAFNNFYGRLVMGKDGRLNVQRLAQERDSASTDPAEESSSPRQENEAEQDIRIDTVVFRGGTVDFMDRSIHPNFSVKLVEMTGSVSGLSSSESARSNVDVKGKWDRYAPFSITGQINPLAKEFFMDMKANFAGIDLPSVTPYSGKYFGYEIEKGKLSFAVQYRIDKRKLDSTNQIFLDQMTFGKRVNSPDATTLPVSLAVALLKDRRGQIKLDIPVYGTLDDPEFSVWKIVWKVIENLLIKAATSPFSLLGALFGGGEELSYGEFDYGDDILSDEMQKKIAALSKALAEHPEMKIEIEGYVDREKDGEALKKQRLEREMKVLKYNSMDRRDQKIAKPEDVTLEKEEYELWLRKVYAAKKFPKPRNMVGLEKTLPTTEMKELIYAHTVIRDDDLRLLAGKRAENTKEAILALGEVEAERVFIASSNYAAPTAKEGLKKSRVDFRLK